MPPRRSQGSSKPMPRVNPPGACWTRTTATWRAAGTTSTPTPPTRIRGSTSSILKAEQRYTEVGSQLAKAFVKQFAKAKHPIPGMLRQVQVFEKQVKPRLGEQKTAYVWVDALRFEMARELGEVLKGDFDLTLQPALATIPTITEIGMASLVPRADQGVKVVPVGGGKLGLEVAGTVLKDRKDRIAFLKAHAGVSVYDAKLDDLLPKPSKKVRDGIQGGGSGPDHLAGDRRTLRGRQHHPGPPPDGRGAQRPAAWVPSPGRPRDQDDHPRRRSRSPVRRGDRRGHEDRSPWRGDG